MNLKHTIAENLEFFQWLVTWLILVLVLLAGHFLLPITEGKYQELLELDIELRATNSGHINGLAFVLPFTSLIWVSLFGSFIISLIWQFRFVKKESAHYANRQGR